MNALLRWMVIAVALPLHALLAADGTQWGQPVNGLRLGLESADDTTTADQNPLFTITAQNVSTKPIRIPTPDTFLLKSNPGSNDFHERPLSPVVQETSPQPVAFASVHGDPARSYGDNGQPPKESSPQTVTLAPGESITWNGVPLERHYYIGDRLPPGDKTSIEHLQLLPGGQYAIRFQFANEQTRVAGVDVWTGKVQSQNVPLQVNAPSTEGIKLEGSFSLPKERYFFGEPIEVTFAVKNQGDAVVKFPHGSDYRSTGRPDRFTIRAVDERGEAVRDPVKPGAIGGGLGGSRALQPGETYTEKLLVNLWCAFPGPGKYAIRCQRTLNVRRMGRSSKEVWSPFDFIFPAIPVETTLNVTIDDDPAALAAYLSGLTPTDTDGHLQLRSLALAGNSAAFPFIVRLLDGPPEVQSMGVEWLSHYPADKVSPILIEHFPRLAPQPRRQALSQLGLLDAAGAEPLIAAALRDKDPETRSGAVWLCSKRAYGSCTPVLLAMQNDADPLVRRYLCAALGTSGDRRAIPLLLKLLHDQDRVTRVWAAGALGKFKRLEGVPVLMDLLRDPKGRWNEGNAMETLQTLTGKDFSDNHSAWLEWWNKTGRAEYGKR